MSTQTHKYIYINICITILMYEYDVFYSGYIYIYMCVLFVLHTYVLLSIYRSIRMCYVNIHICIYLMALQCNPMTCNVNGM